MTRLRFAGLALLLLLLAAPSAHAAPVVFWANDPVDPGNAVQVLGSDLQGARVTVEMLGRGRAPPSAAKVEQAGPEALKFTLPPGLPKGVYRYIIKTESGQAEGVLNAPVVYWLQGDGGATATPGGWVRILGRNIGRTPQAQARLSGPKGRTVVVRASKFDLWDASYPLPTSLSPGDYRVELSNGDGGAQAWRGAGVLQVRSAARWASLVINAREAGASGLGRRDDAPAIQAALDRAAAAGGGAVLLPRGYYRLEAALHVPAGVTLRGRDRTLTNLVFADFETPPASLIDLGSDSALEDLSIAASRYVHGISGGFPKADDEPDGHDITVRRVILRASAFRGHLTPADIAERVRSMLTVSSGGGDSLRLAGRNLVVEDCDLLGSGRGLYLLRARFARVTGNRILNGRYGWYSISGADGVIFENNLVEGADLQSTGGGLNTLGGGPASQNALMRGNRFERMLGWDGEAFTTDGPTGFYYGGAVSEGADVRLANPTSGRNLDRAAGAGLFVTAGAGAGQHARVLSILNGLVRLDHPLAVSLDATSTVSVAPYQGNYLIIGNQFEDASVAAQIYGVSVDHVIAGNVSRRTGGFNDLGRVYGGGVQPSWHTQILDNQITQAALAGPSAIRIHGAQLAPSTTSLNVGTVVRGNRLDGNAGIEVRGVSSEHPGLTDAIVEDNIIEQSDHGVTLDRGAVRVLVRGNTVRP